jgi:metallo-beta-lactamase family protein
MAQPRLTFAGGAGTVTGSKFLVEAEGVRLLIDCGMFQGIKALRLRNWAAPPFDPRSIDAVLLTHAHLDHTGYLPILARNGFDGPIYGTPGTLDLTRVVLRDAAYVQQEDARRANRLGYTKHHPALPLFTAADAERALAMLRPVEYGRELRVTETSRALFRRAGHILGASTIELEVGSRRVVFSGDLGRWNRPILRDPELVPAADVLVVESTYGDRVHPSDAEEQLARIVIETARRGGAVIVPAFAIGRTQELIWALKKLEQAGRLPLISVYIDSPMATSVTDIYCRHPEDHDIEMQLLMDQARCPLRSRDYHHVRTADESRALNERGGSMVIIAGSGMATGGRVLHHLEHRLPDERNTVLLCGYQAVGTRGRALQEGARSIRIFGRDVAVRARVETIDGLSAHADKNELLRWMRGLARPPHQTWIVHGEPGAATALAASVRAELGWRADVAVDGASVRLGSS